MCSFRERIQCITLLLILNSGGLKEMIQSEMDVPPSKQVLRGWLNSKNDTNIEDHVSHQVSHKRSLLQGAKV